ncbi:hypothetical protein CH313_26855 [Streptomyces sp. TSRI0384-2]|uniref:hypothetical protein n=1 Tax=Streptomyces sp. TSRI0384-2 TaxID=2020331 RepID=UPI000C2663DC|nr:hypothetical protein [Streptomyces sp. TSRI0384-2]PJM80617.1 hypothetical protein CH313_26855 [Streptomyces sp. TSRI0384-2]
MDRQIPPCHHTIRRQQNHSKTLEPPSKKLEAAVKAIDQARSELDEALFREHPGEAQPSVYYPPSEDRVAFPSPQER